MRRKGTKPDNVAPGEGHHMEFGKIGASRLVAAPKPTARKDGLGVSAVCARRPRVGRPNTIDVVPATRVSRRAMRADRRRRRKLGLTCALDDAPFYEQVYEQSEQDTNEREDELCDLCLP